MNNQNNSPLMTAKLILFFVIRTKGHITKTQLFKFLYLADLYSAKWLGKQITNLNWCYYNHGPWEQDIQSCLDALSEEQIIQQVSQGNTVLIEPGTQIPKESKLKIPTSMEFVLDNIRREWAGSGHENFQNLMSYVYNTAPMKDVLQRGFKSEDKEPLNLSLAKEQLEQELEV